MNEKAETKTRKKTEHTRIVAQLYSSANEIFTSVVVYSRTTNVLKCNNQTTRFASHLLRLLQMLENRWTKKWRHKKRKKNGAHTNSCTTVQLGEHNIHVGCCLFSHNKRNSPKTITKNALLLWRAFVIVLASCSVISKRKKNGAHTHVRTTVQLGEWNIHVGCCLFSHITNKNKTKIQSWLGSALKCFIFGVCNNITLRWNAKKKKKDDVYVILHNCAARKKTRYSRRLLSILAPLT